MTELRRIYIEDNRYEGRSRKNRKIQTGEKRVKKQKPERQQPLSDYSKYRLSPKEGIGNLLTYIILIGVISVLFYRSLTAFLLLLPGCFLFMKDRAGVLAAQRENTMREEFLTAMQSFETSLKAGSSAENAVRESITEMEKIYSPDCFIVTELKVISGGMSLNEPIEKLMKDLGRRSHIDDIRSFADVFGIARRTGGDLIAITANTVKGLQQKQETRMEVATVLAGKKMEQNVMSLIPMGILLYVSLTSPGFLDPMYENFTGRLIMSVCLAVYLIAYLWGRKIMDIRV